MNRNNYYNIISTILFIIMVLFSGIGIVETVAKFNGQSTIDLLVIQDDKTLPKTKNSVIPDDSSESSEYISGDLSANLGELCVFQLNDPDLRADWIIVPETKYYIDSSGSSLAFASNVPARYTIVAAIVVEGQSKILTHLIDYGISPEPAPSPKPDPEPKPEPVTLSHWVRKNIPPLGLSQAAALASCYESAVSGIENGTIKSQAAAYSLIRTTTQTKINIALWQSFLDQLSVKITERLNGSTDVKELAVIFSEIITGLKAVSVIGTVSGISYDATNYNTQNRQEMWTLSKVLTDQFPCGHSIVFQALAAASSPPAYSDTALCVPSKKMPIAETSSSITKIPVILSRSQFGTISQHLTDISGTDLLTWYKADFRVKILAPAVSVPASPEREADYGKRCTELFAKSSRVMSLSKMCAIYSCGAWQPSSPTFPPQGSMQNGVCYPHPPLERAINAHDFGYSENRTLFPTPSTYGVGGSWGKQKFKEIFGIDSRQMNPMWLANIMGFPTDWTHCEVLEMPKYRSVPQWLSRFCISG
jgi:hypothetical protein